MRIKSNIWMSSWHGYFPKIKSQQPNADIMKNIEVEK